MTETFIKAKEAGRRLALMTDDERGEVLRSVADAIVDNKETLLRANAEDLAKMERSNPLYDRLMLTEDRLEAIAADMRAVAGLPSPLGRTQMERTLANGLMLKKVSVPFGVIGMRYEARPNVTFDVFALCF